MSDSNGDVLADGTDSFDGPTLASQATDANAEHMTAEAERWPTLIAVLETYFATGREIAFLEKYERLGETTAEFEGLSDDLRKAIKEHRRSTPVVNYILGTDTSPSDMRVLLSELLDQITETGEFSEEAVAEREAEREAERATPEQMWSYYAMRRVRLWGPLKRFEVPLFAILVGGFAITGFGLLLGKIPWPSWLAWFPVTFLALGLVVIGISSLTMYALRNEIRDPEKERERNQKRAQAKEKEEAEESEGRFSGLKNWWR